MKSIQSPRAPLARNKLPKNRKSAPTGWARFVDFARRDAYSNPTSALNSSIRASISATWACTSVK